MARQVVGMFDSVRDAQAAVRELQSIGINKADISFVASNARGEYDETGTYVGGSAAGNESKAAEGAGTGAAGGAVLGGLAGVLVGLGALAIPGIGPVLAAGPFAAAIGTTGAAVGGGIPGAAAGTSTGIPCGTPNATAARRQLFRAAASVRARTSPVARHAPAITRPSGLTWLFHMPQGRSFLMAPGTTELDLLHSPRYSNDSHTEYPRRSTVSPVYRNGKPVVRRGRKATGPMHNHVGSPGYRTRPGARSC